MSTSSSAPLAVVTGASTGIGKALARQFVEHGYDVVVAADEDTIHDAARELSAGGRLVEPVEVDLATPEGVEGLAARVELTGRPVDALALNAGIGVHGRFVDNDLADELRLVDLNVRSTVHLAHLLVRPMVDRGRGRLLVTSSVVATGPGPFHATYAASKAFGHSFAEAIRHELKDSGVTVTSLMPGATDTEFFARADMGGTRVAEGPKDDPDDVARDAFEALMAGKASVVAGRWQNRVLAEVNTHLPDTVAAAVAARVSEPGERGSQVASRAAHHSSRAARASSSDIGPWSRRRSRRNR